MKATASNKDLIQHQEGTGTVANWLAAVKNDIFKSKTRIEAALPKGYSAERFMSTAYYYLQGKEELWGLNPEKLMRCFMQIAQQGLDLGIPNEVHIVKFGTEPSIMRGYKGYLKMARRSETVDNIDANAVCENDTYERTLGDQVSVNHVPARLGQRGEIVGFYAIAHDTSNNVHYDEMDNDEVWAHAKRYVKATKTGPFVDVKEKGPKATHWESYGLKTVIIALCMKKLDLTSEMAEAIGDEIADEKTTMTPLSSEPEIITPVSNALEVVTPKKYKPKVEAVVEVPPVEPLEPGSIEPSDEPELRLPKHIAEYVIQGEHPFKGATVSDIGIVGVSNCLNKEFGAKGLTEDDAKMVVAAHDFYKLVGEL